MKKLFFFIVIFSTALIFNACRRVDLVEAPVDNGSTQISMKISANASVSAVGDTIKVERGVIVNFQAVSNGPSIQSWQWTFGDDGSTASGSNVSHTFMSYPPAQTSVKLVGVDNNNKSYQTTKSVQIQWTIDGSPAVKWISSTQVSGQYNVVLAFNKAGMKYSGSQYFYIGSMTNWVSTSIATADTNYLVVGDSLVTPNIGDIGKYVVVRLLIAPGAYQMGVGKIVNGQPLWGQFWDSTMVKFSLSNGGIVTINSNVSPAAFPGTVGDTGPNATLRFDVLDSTLIIYSNNQKVFSSIKPYIVLQDSNGIWQNAVAESAVSDFPNWGMVTLKYSDLPITNLLIMRFGPNISSLTVYAEMSSSIYWDQYYQVLKAIFQQVSASKMAKQHWTLSPMEN